MNPFFRTNSAMPTSSQQQQQQQQQLSNLIQQQQQQLQQQQKKLAGLMELNSYFIQFWVFIFLISIATLFVNKRSSNLLNFNSSNQNMNSNLLNSAIARPQHQLQSNSQSSK